MRKERIFQWVAAVIVAIIFWRLGIYKDYLDTKPPEPEKQKITVNAPEDMQTAFGEALVVAGLNETHEIVMTDEVNANICVDYAKQNDENYQKIAFSPFVVAYNTSSDCQKKLKKTGVFVESPYDEDYLEVNFMKIINEAIGEGKWANLGLKDENKLKVFYPSKDSKYWQDFYNFLVITVNDGKYPKTTTEMQNAEEVIEQFLDSEYTEGVNDFYEQVERTGGFPTTAFYVLPEKDALDVCDKQSKAADIYYPINTVYFNCYVKGDEVGKQIIDNLGKTTEVFLTRNNFYEELSSKRYRSVQYSKVNNNGSYTNYERDIFNVVKIPEVVELVEEPEQTEPVETTAAIEPVETTSPTEASYITE